MISIKSFFEDTSEDLESHSDPSPNQVIRMSTSALDIPLVTKDFAFIPPPKEGTDKFESDMESVMQCMEKLKF